MVENNNPLEVINIAKDENGFTGFHGGQPYPFAKGEKKVLPKYVAEHVAKQMLDKILQEEYNEKDSFTDSPKRRKLLYTILPWKEADDIEMKKDELSLRNNVDAVMEVQKLKREMEKKETENSALKNKVDDLQSTMDKILEKLDNKKEKKEKKDSNVDNE